MANLWFNRCSECLCWEKKMQYHPYAKTDLESGFQNLRINNFVCELENKYVGILSYKISECNPIVLRDYEKLWTFTN